MPMDAPLMIPEVAKVLPEFTFHVWLALSAIGVPKVKLTADVDISMPPDPSVSVPVPVTPTADKAFTTPMPPQEVEDPNVRLAPSEVLAQVATSPEPGAVLPVQLAPAVRSMPVAALVMGAAWETLTRVRRASVNASARLESVRILGFIDLNIGFGMLKRSEEELMNEDFRVKKVMRLVMKRGLLGFFPAR